MARNSELIAAMPVAAQTKDDEPVFVVWDAGGPFSYVYTKHLPVAKHLRRMFGVGTTYTYRGKLVATQHRVPKKRLRFLRKQLEGHLLLENGTVVFSGLDNQQLRDGDSKEFNL